MNWRGLALLVALIAIGSANPARASDKACDHQGCISKSKFAINLYNALNGKVVGYSILVGGWFPYYGGLSRTAANPPKQKTFAAETMNVASVTKVLTGIGVVQSLSKHGLTLDDKIWPYLYPDWRASAGANINTITFRELMTHRSGFRVDCSGSPTYALLKTQIEAGVKLKNKKKASYNNCNFAIFRELLPFMEGHPISGSDASRASQSADFYIDYMNSHVFKKAGLSTRGCKPVATPGSSVVLSYPNPAGSARGLSWGNWTLKCGAGGWNLSAPDLYTILVDLMNGKLMSKSDTALMLAPPPHCIAWDCAQGAKCPDPYLCKNGFLHAGNAAIRTYIGIFKCTVPVVVLINSGLPSGTKGGIVGLVTQAYNAAKVPGRANACPRR